MALQVQVALGMVAPGEQAALEGINMPLQGGVGAPMRGWQAQQPSRLSRPHSNKPSNTARVRCKHRQALTDTASPKTMLELASRPSWAPMAQELASPSQTPHSSSTPLCSDTAQGQGCQPYQSSVAALALQYSLSPKASALHSTLAGRTSPTHLAAQPLGVQQRGAAHALKVDRHRQAAAHAAGVQLGAAAAAAGVQRCAGGAAGAASVHHARGTACEVLVYHTAVTASRDLRQAKRDKKPLLKGSKKGFTRRFCLPTGPFEGG